MLWLSVFEAVVVRELLRFRYQTSRLISAIVRPTLWLARRATTSSGY